MYHLATATAGNANSSEIQVRGVFTFPSCDAAIALATVPDGCMSYPAFHATFLQAQLVDTDADVRVRQYYVAKA